MSVAVARVKESESSVCVDSEIMSDDRAAGSCKARNYFDSHNLSFFRIAKRNIQYLRA